MRALRAGRALARKPRKPQAATDAPTAARVQADIEGVLGEGAVMRLGGSAVGRAAEFGVVPSGSLGLDAALGVGGYPRGRMIEIFGPESSGKTTLALHAIAEAQKTGGVCAFIDAEHALDPEYARRLGVVTNDLLCAQPDTGEQALELVDALLRSKGVDVIVVDSVAALVPKAEMEAEMGTPHVGLHARLMSQAMRKLVGLLSNSRALLVFINQLRMKVGFGGMYGSPETTTGGQALRFYASQRLDIRRIGVVKRSDGEVIASQVRVKTVKNKLAPPFRTVEFDIDFGTGISKLGELVDYGVQAGLIAKSGAWYSLSVDAAGVPTLPTDETTMMALGQGREKCKTALEEQPDLARQLEAAVREVLFSGNSADSTVEDVDDEAVDGGDAVVGSAAADVGASGQGDGEAVVDDGSDDTERKATKKASA